ncbi:MAG: hypothetical protein HY796_11420 [Elusimicrobia bacterium]|nr:hypothetical protein [Elusimicrobiota bacterium]
MIIIRLILFLAVSALAPVNCRAEDLNKIYGDALGAWMDGRPQDAAGSLKYVVFRSSDTRLAGTAIKDLSVLLAELGKHEEALAYLAKAEIMTPEDPCIYFEKGWNLLSLENHMDARTALEHALTLTADADLRNQARFALALAEPHLAGPAEAITHLQAVYQHYPYLLSPAAARISANYETLKKRAHAVTFLKEALSYDPREIQAEIDLARLYEEADYHVPAWQTYYTLSELDPGEPFFEEKAKKLAKYVKGKLDNLLYWTRLSWPAHNRPVNYDDRNLIRIGLFSGPDAQPAVLTEFSFICNTDFSVTDARLGPVSGGKANMQWNVRYSPMNRIYELRDNSGVAVYSTRNSLRLAPRVKGGIILIKNPEPLLRRGVNRSDREVTGELNIQAKENGFRLVNSVGLENCVPAIVSVLAGSSRQIEELKALSIVVRTRLITLKNSKPHEDAEFDLCDGDHCIVFPGLQAESEAAGIAAALAKDEILSKDGAPAGGYFHTACGGFTEEEINDGGRRPAPLTPFGLNLLLLKSPPDDLLCLAQDKTTSSDVYWTLLLEPRWIENRANRASKIGYIKAITALKRSQSGKVQSIRIEGTAGSMTVEGFENISRILTAGALRSALFTIRPLYEGKYPKFFVLRGLGTGSGKGYCILGGRGMVKNAGAKSANILNHYFPYYKVKKLLK